jgi:hypothetical protein
MGQSKQKRSRIAQEPCLCGSQKQAALCCFQAGRFHRASANVVLVNPARTATVEGCYLTGLGSCGGKLSREHLVSESVLRFIGKEELRVEGAPWQAPGTSKTIGFSALTCRCLCRDHNAALSPLDTAAAKFFSEISEAYLNKTKSGRRALLSGHDIERWALKTLFALIHSETLMQEGQKLPAARFHSSIDIAAQLMDPDSWPRGAGLYCRQPQGERFSPQMGITMQALTDTHSGEIMGLDARILGIQFRLIATTPSAEDYGGYRPSALRLEYSDFANVVELSWSDTHNHNDAVFKFNGD